MLICVAALLMGATSCGWERDATAASPGVYAALGASDAVGVGAAQPTEDGWVPRVHAGLPRGTRLLNLGISGATVADVLRQEVPPAVDADPRWVSLWPGVNDLRARVPLDTFATQLDSVLGHFSEANPTAEAEPTLIVLNIPDLRHLPVFAGVDEQLLDQTVRGWNGAIAAAAQRHNAVLVDLYAHWPELAGHPEYISADGFHPSSEGYARVADIVLETLEQHAASTAP